MYIAEPSSLHQSCEIFNTENNGSLILTPQKVYLNETHYVSAQAGPSSGVFQTEVTCRNVSKKCRSKAERYPNHMHYPCNHSALDLKNRNKTKQTKTAFILILTCTLCPPFAPPPCSVSPGQTTWPPTGTTTACSACWWGTWTRASSASGKLWPSTRGWCPGESRQLARLMFSPQLNPS